MKNLFSVFIALFLVSVAMAQVPQGISYQAIAFTAGGSPVANGNVGIKISILDNSANGTVVYAETHTRTTNAQGLFNLNIGQGIPASGTFAAINWGANSKFLKVEIDPAGGSNYTITGTNQLMSVPFALVAASITGSGANSVQEQLLENKSANFGFRDGYDNKMYVFNAKTGVWSSQTYNNQGTPTLYAQSGNFYFQDGYDNKFYTYSARTGQWSSQTYNNQGTPSLITDTLSGNYAFRDGYDNKIYVYNVKTGVWSSQTYNSQGTPTIYSSKGNFSFRDGYDYIVYVYNSNSGTWHPQSYNSQGTPTVSSWNGNFYFRDGYDNKFYVFSASAGNWSSQSYNSQGTPTMVVSPQE